MNFTHYSFVSQSLLRAHFHAGIQNKSSLQLKNRGHRPFLSHLLRGIQILCSNSIKQPSPLSQSDDFTHILLGKHNAYCSSHISDCGQLFISLLGIHCRRGRQIPKSSLHFSSLLQSGFN